MDEGRSEGDGGGGSSCEGIVMVWTLEGDDSGGGIVYRE